VKSKFIGRQMSNISHCVDNHRTTWWN